MKKRRWPDWSGVLASWTMHGLRGLCDIPPISVGGGDLPAGFLGEDS